MALTYVVTWPKASFHLDEADEDVVVVAGHAVPAGVDPFTLDTLVLVGAVSIAPPDWVDPDTGATSLTPATPEQGSSDPAAAPAGTGPAMPEAGAPKADWVTYAIARGADPAAATALTKESLMASYGTPA